MAWLRGMDDWRSNITSVHADVGNSLFRKVFRKSRPQAPQPVSVRTSPIYAGTIPEPRLEPPPTPVPDDGPVGIHRPVIGRSPRPTCRLDLSKQVIVVLSEGMPETRPSLAFREVGPHWGEVEVVVRWDCSVRDIEIALREAGALDEADSMVAMEWHDRHNHTVLQAYEPAKGPVYVARLVADPLLTPYHLTVILYSRMPHIMPHRWRDHAGGFNASSPSACPRPSYMQLVSSPMDWFKQEESSWHEVKLKMLPHSTLANVEAELRATRSLEPDESVVGLDWEQSHKPIRVSSDCTLEELGIRQANSRVHMAKVVQTSQRINDLRAHELDQMMRAQQQALKGMKITIILSDGMPFVKPSVFNKTVTPCWRELTVTVPFNAVVSDLETALRDTYELKQYQKVYGLKWKNRHTHRISEFFDSVDNLFDAEVPMEVSANRVVFMAVVPKFAKQTMVCYHHLLRDVY